MKSTVEKTEKNQVKITITVDAETFKSANHGAYLKGKADISVPGFRKGKAPLNIIIQRYGETTFYDDAFDEVFPDAYSSALKENDIQPVERPSINILEIGKQGVKFTCDVTVMPEIKLGKYKGVTIKAAEFKVTAKQVNAQIESERDKIARWVDIERAAEKGDRVTIDYKGFVDEKAFEGGEAQGHDLEIGSGSFIPGFEDQIIGMNKNDTKDIIVTFPEEYHNEDLKGKKARFEVKVNEIKVKEIPELDDEFAKDVSEFDTLDEYKKDIRNNLNEEAKNKRDADIENLLIAEILKDCKVDIPQPMIEREIDNLLNDMQRRMSYQGIKMEDYLRMTNTDINTLREQFKNDAENKVKTQLMFDAIKKAENFEVTDTDIEAELEIIAKSSAKSIEEIKKTFNEDNMSYLKDTAMTKKTMKYIKDNATINVLPEKKKAPANKKTSAKSVPAKKASADKAKKKTSPKNTTADKAKKKAPAKKEN